MANRNATRLLRNNDRDGVRFFGDAERRPMAQAKTAIQCLTLAHRENAGRSSNSAVADDHAAVMQRRFRMKNAEKQLDRKIRIERHPGFFVNANGCVAFDPGIGFGKTLKHNLLLLKNIDQLRVNDRPLIVGVSRKSFLGKLAGSDEMRDRIGPTVALTAILRERGADILRVHDVKENVAALRTVEGVS